ncbi:MAG: hypothetical protein QXU99_01060 [Candidatus Bathyarchaeia archaeon]
MESLPYVAGQLICFVIVPTMLFFGIAVCILEQHKRKVEKALPVEAQIEKHKTYLPAWLVWLRRLLASSIFVWILVVIALFGVNAFLMFAIHIAASLIVVAYAFSKKRGMIGTAATVLISSSVLASLVYFPLILFFWPYTSWHPRID